MFDDRPTRRSAQQRSRRRSSHDSWSMRINRLVVLMSLAIFCGLVIVQMIANSPETTIFSHSQTTPTMLPLLPTVTPAALQQTSMGVPTLMQSQLPSAPLRESDIQLGAAIDQYVDELVEQQRFSGAVLVARHGAILVNKGYGMADVEAGIPNTPQTRFRLASLSKPFTAAAILILQADGKLQIDRSVCDYLPECPEAWQPVYIRHLLNHTSGIPNYTSFFDFEATEMYPTTPDELMRRFRDMPLAFVPGEGYAYSNSGYVLLGLIIEHVSGQSYEDFLHERIFEPLQMHDTGYDQQRDMIRDQAVGYRIMGERATFLDASTLYASGGLYGSIEDMYRWDQALYTEYPLPSALQQEMYTPGNDNYGYGWWITNAFGRRAISHTGLLTGFSNYIVRFPDERVVVIVFGNVQTAPAEIIGDTIARMVLEAP